MYLEHFEEGDTLFFTERLKEKHQIKLKGSARALKLACCFSFQGCTEQFEASYRTMTFEFLNII